MIDQGLVEQPPRPIEALKPKTETGLISEMPTKTLAERIKRKNAGNALDYLLKEYEDKTRLMGLGDFHHEGGKEGKSFAAFLIKELAAADKIDTVFLELRRKKQEVINSYLSGQLSDSELIDLYVAGIPKDKAIDPRLAIENYLPVLQATKEMAKNTNLVVRCVDTDISYEERIFFPLRNIPMLWAVINYLETHPQARGFYYAGGAHIARQDHSDYEEINKHLSLYHYKAFQQTERPDNNLVKAARMARIKQSILLPTKGTILEGKRENWAYKFQPPIDQRFDGVIIHPVTIDQFLRKRARRVSLQRLKTLIQK